MVKFEFEGKTYNQSRECKHDSRNKEKCKPTINEVSKSADLCHLEIFELFNLAIMVLTFKTYTWETRQFNLTVFCVPNLQHVGTKKYLNIFYSSSISWKKYTFSYKWVGAKPRNCEFESKSGISGNFTNDSNFFSTYRIVLYGLRRYCMYFHQVPEKNVFDIQYCFDLSHALSKEDSVNNRSRPPSSMSESFANIRGYPLAAFFGVSFACSLWVIN